MPDRAGAICGRLREYPCPAVLVHQPAHRRRSAVRRDICAAPRRNGGRGNISGRNLGRTAYGRRFRWGRGSLSSGLLDEAGMPVLAQSRRDSRRALPCSSAMLTAGRKEKAVGKVHQGLRGGLRNHQLRLGHFKLRPPVRADAFGRGHRADRFAVCRGLYHGRQSCCWPFSGVVLMVVGHAFQSGHEPFGRLYPRCAAAIRGILRQVFRGRGGTVCAPRLAAQVYLSACRPRRSEHRFRERDGKNTINKISEDTSFMFTTGLCHRHGGNCALRTALRYRLLRGALQDGQRGGGRFGRKIPKKFGKVMVLVLCCPQRRAFTALSSALSLRANWARIWSTARRLGDFRRRDAHGDFRPQQYENS